MKYILFFFCLILVNCTPKVLVKDTLVDLPPVPYYESFAVFELQDSFNLKDYQFVGNVEVKENGASIICDYETVKNLAIKKARVIGGNCLKIIEHKEPNLWSTCHQIKCEVLNIPNARPFDKQIDWHPKRPLEIIDFKGSTDKRPFQAVTASAFTYSYHHMPLSKKITINVRTYFDCDKSYFKQSEHDAYVLGHEQLHFNISELYARKFIKRIQEECKNLKEFNEKHNVIYDEITTSLFKKQDEYDSEVYVDRSKQEKWNNWVDTELKLFDQYFVRTFTINKK